MRERAPAPYLVRLPRDDTLPSHVAIIMDGNGRWAQSQGESRLAGHKAGVRSIRPVMERLDESDIHILTLYAFSSENWRRPADEVSGLMDLFRQTLQEEVPELNEKGIQIRILGHREDLDPDLRSAIGGAELLTAHNDKGILNVAINYGGRRELLDCMEELLGMGSNQYITEEAVDALLETAGLPDPDLVVRTAGEMRISNFLLWQTAYAEMYVTQTAWPQFGPNDMSLALKTYRSRERHFGGVGSAAKSHTPTTS